MKTKQEYQTEMESQMAKLQTQIDELKVKASLAKADAKDKYHEQIETLNSKCQTARGKLQELKASSNDAWEEIKVGLDNAWNELQSAFNRASNRFE
ncbi:MAG: hypothetical protein KME64_33835 [Scytonematopsis contorta HA4267-MV1]|jgi:chromosome segregation ATPase|nr:hypothetical protein [Scytonematopsis contorta HA4267-MV1]